MSLILWNVKRQKDGRWKVVLIIQEDQTAEWKIWNLETLEVL
jgi:hypothetical protein